MWEVQLKLQEASSSLGSGSAKQPVLGSTASFFFPLISPRQMQEACLDPLGRCSGELALLLCGQALEIQE